MPIRSKLAKTTPKSIQTIMQKHVSQNVLMAGTIFLQMLIVTAKIHTIMCLTVSEYLQWGWWCSECFTLITKLNPQRLSPLEDGNRGHRTSKRLSWDLHPVYSQTQSPGSWCLHFNMRVCVCARRSAHLCGCALSACGRWFLCQVPS